MTPYELPTPFLLPYFFGLFDFFVLSLLINLFFFRIYFVYLQFLPQPYFYFLVLLVVPYTFLIEISVVFFQQIYFINLFLFLLFWRCTSLFFSISILEITIKQKLVSSDLNTLVFSIFHSHYKCFLRMILFLGLAGWLFPSSGV